jgi:hypothetical protein
MSVSVCDQAQNPLTYAWRADAGTLSAVDTNPVIWTAPRSEGHYRVGVEVTNAAGRTSKGSAGILVTKYPAAQPVMSADSMDGKW